MPHLKGSIPLGAPGPKRTLTKWTLTQWTIAANEYIAALLKARNSYLTGLS
jgi:hypothetical protein